MVFLRNTLRTKLIEQAMEEAGGVILLPDLRQRVFFKEHKNSKNRDGIPKSYVQSFNRTMRLKFTRKIFRSDIRIGELFVGTATRLMACQNIHNGFVLSRNVECQKLVVSIFLERYPFTEKNVRLSGASWLTGIWQSPSGKILNSTSLQKSLRPTFISSNGFPSWGDIVRCSTCEAQAYFLCRDGVAPISQEARFKFDMWNGEKFGNLPEVLLPDGTIFLTDRGFPFRWVMQPDYKHVIQKSIFNPFVYSDDKRDPQKTRIRFKERFPCTNRELL